jgi:hypothetical protein
MNMRTFALRGVFAGLLLWSATAYCGVEYSIVDIGALQFPEGPGDYLVAVDAQHRVLEILGPPTTPPS